MFAVRPRCLIVWMSHLVSDNRRNSLLKITLWVSNLAFPSPRLITSPGITCRTLGISAYWHAIAYTFAATVVPWQYAEHKSLVPVSSTTTVVRFQRAHPRYDANAFTHMPMTPISSTLSYSCVRLRAPACACVRLRAPACACVRLRAPACARVRPRAPACARVRPRAPACACVRLHACVCVDVHACVQNRPVFSLSACLILSKDPFRYAQDLSGLGVSRNTSLHVYMKNVVKALKHECINQSERKTIKLVYD